MKSEIIVLKHIHFKFTDGSSCEYITAHLVESNPHVCVPVRKK